MPCLTRLRATCGVPQGRNGRDIERRCREVHHALLVIGHLEDWVIGTEGVLSQELIAFYSSLRRKVIEAEASNSSEILERQMFRVLELRGHWQHRTSATSLQDPRFSAGFRDPGQVPRPATSRPARQLVRVEPWPPTRIERRWIKSNAVQFVPITQIF